MKENVHIKGPTQTAAFVAQRLPSVASTDQKSWPVMNKKSKSNSTRSGIVFYSTTCFGLS